MKFKNNRVNSSTTNKAIGWPRIYEAAFMPALFCCSLTVAAVVASIAGDAYCGVTDNIVATMAQNPSVALTSSKTTSTAMKEFPFEKRQRNHLKKYSSPEERSSVRRIISYNVLADCYTSQQATAEMIFSYCPREFLDSSYRKDLIVRELTGYDADIICLQEVDEHLFKSDYHPALSKLGYNGHFAERIKLKKEGVAVFYRREKFDLVKRSSHYISDNLIESDPKFFALTEKLSQAPHIKELASRTSVLQLVHLIDRTTGDHLLIANTHLYFEWTSNTIRLVQAFVWAQIISRMQTAIKVRYGVEPKVIFCGDLNSDHRRGVYRLLTTGSVPGNFAEFYEGGKKNFIEDAGDTFTIDLRLFAASGRPEYTTYVPGYAAAIDYIYAEQGQFEVSAVLPMYDEDECMALIALPNEFFPSDHMAVVVDLKYKHEANNSSF